MKSKLYTVLILAAVGILSMTGCHTGSDGKENRKAENAYMKISAEEAKEIMDGATDFLLIDVREKEEYAEGHIEGALLIPYDEIEESAGSLLADKQQTILIYCRSGRRSAIAAQTLSDLGYTDVKDFGGIIDWPYDIKTE